jgi:hypothetical protein
MTSTEETKHDTSVVTSEVKEEESKALNPISIDKLNLDLINVTEKNEITYKGEPFFFRFQGEVKFGPDPECSKIPNVSMSLFPDPTDVDAFHALDKKIMSIGLLKSKKWKNEVLYESHYKPLLGPGEPKPLKWKGCLSKDVPPAVERWPARVTVNIPFNKESQEAYQSDFFDDNVSAIPMSSFLPGSHAEVIVNANRWFSSANSWGPTRNGEAFILLVAAPEVPKEERVVKKRKFVIQPKN